MDDKSETLEISWVGVLFGLAFFLSGIFGADMASRMFFSYIDTGGWVQVPAEVYEIKLKRSSGDTTTYSVKAEYSYQFDGVKHRGSRVSLSTGSDNMGTYWQDLERRLRRDQASNESWALVDPDNPADAILDRTFRWSSVVMGSIFLILFGGIGLIAIWASIQRKKSRSVRLQDERETGILSQEKNGSWFIAAFGGVFFVMGTGMSLLALPEEIQKGNYAALVLLLFVFIGIGMLAYAFKISMAYRRFGPTPLFLDPAEPGVGGELGGRFSVNASGITQVLSSSTLLVATLTCSSKYQSGRNTRSSVKWQKETPVYLKQTSNGVDALFLFDIPEQCNPTREWDGRSAIEWKVNVKGEFKNSGLGTFERNWSVVVEKAARASRGINIPESALDTAKKRLKDRAEASAIGQIPIEENSRTITINSSATNGLAEKFFDSLLGPLFGGIGVFTVLQNWWPGYVFILTGTAVTLFSIYSMGKSIKVSIDKHARTLKTLESWCGMTYKNREGKLIQATQFELKKTSSTQTGSKVTEYFCLNFSSGGETIRIADTIKGRAEAQALKDAIVERCFVEEERRNAA